MRDGLCVLEGGVGPVPPLILPDQFLLLLSAPEGDPRLPRQPLPLVDGVQEVVLPESSWIYLSSSFEVLDFTIVTIAVDWNDSFL